MSITLSLDRGLKSGPEYFCVVGDTELNEVWKPIIERNDLHYLDYIVGAGIGLDADNYLDIAGEVRVLLDALESGYPYVDDIVNPVFRCRRLLRIINEFSPENGLSVYIG